MKDYIEIFIENAIREDIGNGDHTSLATIPENTVGKAKLIIKDSGILAGIDMVQRVFYFIDNEINLDIILDDGARVLTNDVAFTVEGKVHSILKAERLILNIMQRMSGIATETRRYVEKLQGLKTKVLDTRKTSPGLRFMEKEAVRIGGGANHRMGLFDMILIKDNHIDYAGGIAKALKQTQEYLSVQKKKLKIEIEARNLNDVGTILEIGGIQRIMLDNFSLDDTRKAVEMIKGKFETESSGKITIDNVRDYAECGVDFVSVGALTHHIKSLDMSLKAYK